MPAIRVGHETEAIFIEKHPHLVSLTCLAGLLVQRMPLMCQEVHQDPLVVVAIPDDLHIRGQRSPACLVGAKRRMRQWRLFHNSTAARGNTRQISR